MKLQLLVVGIATALAARKNYVINLSSSDCVGDDCPMSLAAQEREEVTNLADRIASMETNHAKMPVSQLQINPPEKASAPASPPSPAFQSPPLPQSLPIDVPDLRSAPAYEFSTATKELIEKFENVIESNDDLMADLNQKLETMESKLEEANDQKRSMFLIAIRSLRKQIRTVKTVNKRQRKELGSARKQDEEEEKAKKAELKLEQFKDQERRAMAQGQHEELEQVKVAIEKLSKRLKLFSAKSKRVVDRLTENMKELQKKAAKALKAERVRLKRTLEKYNHSVRTVKRTNVFRTEELASGSFRKVGNGTEAQQQRLQPNQTFSYVVDLDAPSSVGADIDFDDLDLDLEV